jgi:hypothetical protein
MGNKKPSAEVLLARKAAAAAANKAKSASQGGKGGGKKPPPKSKAAPSTDNDNKTKFTGNKRPREEGSAPSHAPLTRCRLVCLQHGLVQE